MAVPNANCMLTLKSSLWPIRSYLVEEAELLDGGTYKFTRISFISFPSVPRSISCLGVTKMNFNVSLSFHD